MFSVVRSVILDGRGVCLVCVVPVGYRAASCLILHPRTFYVRENGIDCLVTLLPDLCFTFLLSLPVTVAHRVTLGASVLLMDCSATSLHNGALVCCPSPGASWEIEGLHVKVEPWRRITC